MRRNKPYAINDDRMQNAYANICRTHLRRIQLPLSPLLCAISVWMDTHARLVRRTATATLRSEHNGDNYTWYDLRAKMTVRHSKAIPATTSNGGTILEGRFRPDDSGCVRWLIEHIFSEFIGPERYHGRISTSKTIIQ